ncbi:MAG TPA: class I SAM-dependent methyltransferase [Candidatus Hydrogenedentes bacterium]|nr:class I SAM-dependent methyltransferase [Candidatus Hydrogenedentota bacterium]
MSDALDRLRALRVPVPEGAVDRLRLHAELVRMWNRVCGLVSAGDETRICSRHTCDSLGLLPVFYTSASGLTHWVDIGSGGGFPALPVAIMLEDVRFRLYERSRRKSAFLERAIVELGLSGRVAVVPFSFPDGFDAERACVFTARAVERPEEVQDILSRIMAPGSIFLVQGHVSAAFRPPMFHVEHYSEEWPWRRGPLTLVRRLDDHNVPRGTF